MGVIWNSKRKLTIVRTHMCWHGWHTRRCCQVIKRKQSFLYIRLQFILFTRKIDLVFVIFSRCVPCIIVCYSFFRFWHFRSKSRLQSPKDQTQRSREQEYCLRRKVLCGDLDWSPDLPCLWDISSSKLWISWDKSKFSFSCHPRPSFKHNIISQPTCNYFLKYCSKKCFDWT